MGRVATGFSETTNKGLDITGKQGQPVLASASAHWLRHTAGSHMTDQQVDLRFVRDNMIWEGMVKEGLAIERAIALSHEKYCSASIMIGKTAEITTSFELIETA